MFGLLGCIGFDLMSGIMRRVLGCVCCIACAGPILFIVGIVLIVAPNDRKENVDKYNSAIKTYQSGDMVAIKASTGNAGENAAITALSLSNSPVDVSGNKDGVDSATSWTLQASQVTTSTLGSNRNVIVRIRHGTGAYSTITTSTPLTRTESKSLSCSAFGSHSTGSCSSTALRNRCEDDYDGHGSVSCRKSSGRYKCSMSCAYSSYLTKVCVPVAYNSVSKKWSKSMEFDSCTAPFAARDQTYGASTSQTDIAVTVMSEEDPNIQLEKIAGADRSFGLSAAQQRGLGAALLGVGIAMTVFVYGGIALAIYCFVRSRRGNDNDQNQYQPQPATTGYAQPGQAGYCEPAGYPAQQPQPYAQAPPPQPQAYGAPPPQPYGAPPVPQQQQPYGAPPPQPYGAPPPQQPQPYGAPPQHYAAM